MSNVIEFTGLGYSDFKACLGDVMRKHPKARAGIVVVFDDEDENMVTYFRASDQQIALASVRLGRFVCSDEAEA